MKAVVSITLDDEFVVHDIKVIEGEKGLFIAMPSRKAADGEYRDIAHPINSTTRERIQSMILQEYERAVAEAPEEETPDGAASVEASIRDEATGILMYVTYRHLCQARMAGGVAFTKMRGAVFLPYELIARRCGFSAALL